MDNKKTSILLSFFLELLLFLNSGILYSQENSFLLPQRQVTASDYCDFLNDVCSSDVISAHAKTELDSRAGGNQNNINFNFLYNQKMSSAPYAACITRTGFTGCYKYFLIAGCENMPITFVTSYDKSTYCHWIQKEQIIEKQDTIASSKNEFSIVRTSNLYLLQAEEPRTTNSKNKEQITWQDVAWGAVAFFATGLMIEEARTQSKTETLKPLDVAGSEGTSIKKIDSSEHSDVEERRDMSNSAEEDRNFFLDHLSPEKITADALARAERLSDEVRVNNASANLMEANQKVEEAEQKIISAETALEQTPTWQIVQRYSLGNELVAAQEELVVAKNLRTTMRLELQKAQERLATHLKKKLFEASRKLASLQWLRKQQLLHVTLDQLSEAPLYLHSEEKVHKTTHRLIEAAEEYDIAWLDFLSPPSREEEFRRRVSLTSEQKIKELYQRAGVPTPDSSDKEREDLEVKLLRIRKECRSRYQNLDLTTALACINRDKFASSVIIEDSDEKMDAFLKIQIAQTFLYDDEYEKHVLLHQETVRQHKKALCEAEEGEQRYKEALCEFERFFWNKIAKATKDPYR